MITSLLALLVVIVSFLIAIFPTYLDITNNKKYYNIVKIALERENITTAMKNITYAIKFKRSGRYSAEEANEVIKGLDQLLEICNLLQLNKQHIINPTYTSFQLIAGNGGKVDYKKTHYVSSLANKLLKPNNYKQEIDRYDKEVEIRLYDEFLKEHNMAEDRNLLDKLIDENETDIIDDIYDTYENGEMSLALEDIESHLLNADDIFKYCLLECKAYILQDNSKYQEAKIIYETLLSRFSDDIVTHFNLAVCHQHIGNEAEANRFFSYVINHSVNKHLIQECKDLMKNDNL